MFLNARIFVTEPMKKGIKAPSVDGFDKSKLVYLSMEVAYWRKHNAIHKWFVDNVQDGVEDCRMYVVSRQQLLELVSLCRKALKSSSPWEILPTVDGFFFGGTEYDKYYMDGLESTIAQVEKALELPDSWVFIYNSSW